MVDLIIKFKELIITDIQENIMTTEQILKHVERRNPDVKIDEWSHDTHFRKKLSIDVPSYQKHYKQDALFIMLVII